MSINAWFNGPSAIQSVRASQTQSREASQEPRSAAARDSFQSGGTYLVRKADTLWDISQQVLGDASRWRELHALNQDQVRDPNLIFPGTTLKIPGAKKPAEVEALEQAAEAQYPTVGEYVQKRFDSAVENTIDSVHGAAEVALPPFLLGEMAGIKMRHHKVALDRIMELPMDARGKWRIEARRISDEESAKAIAEIRVLPGVRAISAVGGAVVDGVVATGEAIVAVPRAATRGVLFGLGGIGDALSRFSKWALGE